MVIKTRLAYALAGLIATGGLAAFTTGCDKKEEETEAVEPEEKPVEEPVEEKPAEDTGEVKTDYEGMTPAGGTFRLLTSFNVHVEPDATSKKLTGLAPQTLVNFKNFYRDWILIEWPSGPGELSPGWIQAKSTSSKVTKVDKPLEEKPEDKPDDKTADKTDDKTDDKTADKTDDKTADKTDDKPADKTDDKTATPTKTTTPTTPVKIRLPKFRPTVNPK
ncbi:MAG: hypothetical protein R3B72_33755 [Polyangiaceae bacterium]